ncbi:MAG: hypothetical protein PVG02_06990, partial [Anaerolineales bacterium]
MASTVIERKEVEFTSPTRQRVMGVVFLLLGAAIWFFFSRGVEPGVETTFKLVPGGFDSNLADLILPSMATLNILAFASAFLGGVQLMRGFGKRTNTILALVAGFFIFG